MRTAIISCSDLNVLRRAAVLRNRQPMLHRMSSTVYEPPQEWYAV